MAGGVGATRLRRALKVFGEQHREYPLSGLEVLHRQRRDDRRP